MKTSLVIMAAGIKPRAEVVEAFRDAFDKVLVSGDARKGGRIAHDLPECRIAGQSLEIGEPDPLRRFHTHAVLGHAQVDAAEDGINGKDQHYDQSRRQKHPSGGDFLTPSLHSSSCARHVVSSSLWVLR